MKSILPFIFLLWIVFLVLHNSLSNPRPFRFFLCYLSFVVSRFTFRSRIHFELIFVESVRAVSRFIFWYVDVFSFIFNTLSEEVFKLLNNVSHPSSSQFSWSLSFWQWSWVMFFPQTLDGVWTVSSTISSFLNCVQ